MPGKSMSGGELWNNNRQCTGNRTNLFISYILVPGGQYQFFPLNSALHNQTVGVNWYNSKSNQNFSGIRLEYAILYWRRLRNRSGRLRPGFQVV